MGTKRDIKGKKFGRLLVLKAAPNLERWTCWYCRCDCGSKLVVRTQSLTSGNSKSCGCYKRERTSEVHCYHDPERVFWGKVKKTNDNSQCWLWTGVVNSSGYGSFQGEGAHRFAFKLKNKLEKGLCVLHRCDNRRCCNPNHLFSGTQRINSQDNWKKGRNFFQLHPSARPKGEKHANAKLTWVAVRQIRRKYATGRYRQKDLAQMYASTQAGISQIVRNVSWAIREKERAQC